ncbi:MAG: type I methionyl aminopeptidase [Candidatus Hodarchaeales archaeon]|jgi:methionyl aminopeptidase
MIYLKTPHQINKLEEVNKLGAEFLHICYDHLKVGVIIEELEELAHKFCEKHKVRPSFYKYKGFPHLLCVSINEEIVHGFPDDRAAKNGDVISVDFGIEKDGYFSDAAFTKIIGKAPKIIKKLVKTTKECLYEGIDQASPGNRLYDISWAIQSHASRKGFDVIREYVGHGVGFELHEDPKVPNYVSHGVNWKLRPGMVLAIEPMLVEDSYNVRIEPNRWTVVTADSKIATHFEHSIAILDEGPKILSKL